MKQLVLLWITVIISVNIVAQGETVHIKDKTFLKANDRVLYGSVIKSVNSMYIYSVNGNDSSSVNFTLQDIKEIVSYIDEGSCREHMVFRNDFVIGISYYWYIILDYDKSKVHYRVDDISALKDNLIHMRNVLFLYNNEMKD